MLPPHRFLLFLVLLGLPLHLSGQNPHLELFGIGTEDGPNPGPQFFQKIDLATGQTERLGTQDFLSWPVNYYGGLFPGMIKNSDTEQFVFLGENHPFDPNPNDGWKFFVGDADNSSMDAVFEIPGIGLEFGELIGLLQYDCRDGSYYALKGSLGSFSNNTPGQQTLMKWNTVNQTFDVVGIQDLPFNVSANAVLDYSRNALVFYGRDLPGDRRIVSVDLATGAVLNDPILNSTDFPQEHFIYPKDLTYDCLTHTLYGYLHSVAGVPYEYLVKIDPITGEVTKITPDLHLNLRGNTSKHMLDPVGGRYILATQEWDTVVNLNGNGDTTSVFVTPGDSQHLHTIDVVTGMLMNTVSIKNKTSISGFTLPQPCSAHADFSFDNACLGAPAYFEAHSSDALGWTWDFGEPSSGLENESVERRPVHYFSDTGWFEVRLITQSCFESDTISKMVYVKPFPIIDLGPDTILCPGDTIAFHLPDADSLVYNWSDGSSGPHFYATDHGTIHVTGSSSKCVAKGSVKILATPVAQLDLGANIILCPNKSDTLDVSRFGNSFVWNNNVTFHSIVITDSGTYSVTVSDDFCTLSDSVEVTLSPPIPDLIAFRDTLICPEKTITIKLAPGYDYLWEDGERDAQRTFSGPNLGTREYVITITNEYDCTKEERFSLENHDVDPLVINSANETLYVASNNPQYEWLLAGVNIPGSNTYYQPELLAGVYEVRSLDENNCFTSGSIVLPELPCSALELWPNPVQQDLHLKTHRKVMETVRLLDDGGKEIFRQENINLKQVHLSLPVLPASGIYILEVGTNQCKEVRKVFIGR